MTISRVAAMAGAPVVVGGPGGAPGKSVYQTWLGLPGNAGKTEAQFVDALRGLSVDVRIQGNLIQTSPHGQEVWTTVPGGNLETVFNSYRADAQAAATSATASKNAAATSETNAGTSASSASTSSNSASASATAAAGSAAAANTSATAASGSASAAATSATSAGTSATAAGTSATSAAGSATTATTKAGEASTSAGQAATSATNAGTSASQAATSAAQAVQASPVGKLSYDTAQALTQLEQFLVKANGGIFGQGTSVRNGTQALPATDIGKVIFLPGYDYTLTMPDVTTIRESVPSAIVNAGTTSKVTFAINGSGGGLFVSPSVPNGSPTLDVPFGGSCWIMRSGSNWLVWGQGSPDALLKTTQTLPAADRLQARKNIKVPGGAYGYTSTDLNVDSLYGGYTLYVDASAGTRTLNFTHPNTWGLGEGVKIIAAGTFDTSITVTSGTLYDGKANIGAITLKPGETATLFADGASAWFLSDNSINRRALLLADRVQAPTDTERAQWLANLGLAAPIVNYGRAVLTSALSVTAQTPIDDTIPQSSEMADVVTLAWTPKKATNLLHVRGTLLGGVNTTAALAGGLFKDSDAGALAARCKSTPANYIDEIIVDHLFTAGTTSAMTFKLKGGTSNGAVLTVNGVSGVRVFGGAMTSALEVTEYAA